MPTFVAQVKNRSGKVFQEKIEAMSPDQARTMLGASHLCKLVIILVSKTGF